MSSSSASDALAHIRRLSTQASGPSSSTQSRLELQRGLIELCSLPSFECKEYFCNHISDNFAEFEDLQDQAVDAILDLCEDEEERTRIIGIDGLCKTAEADPRWVRGNTGVLLQLLECPPAELAHVHEALFALLKISPANVFAVMSDDCKSPEAETGASRRNIIDFLSKHAGDRLKRILESGEHVNAEEAFQSGFESVLKVASAAEKEDILNLISRLNSVSGRKRSEGSVRRFLRSVDDALGARDGERAVRVYSDFVAKRPPLDAKSVLWFTNRNARMIFSEAVKRNKDAERIVEGLKDWSWDSPRTWERDDPTSEYAANKLIPGFLHHTVSFIADQLDRKTVDLRGEYLSTLEILLVTASRLVFTRDHRRSLKQSQVAALNELGRLSSQALSHARQDERQALSNVALLAQRLAEPGRRLADVKPSWLTPKPKSQPASRSDRPPTPPLPSSPPLRPSPSSRSSQQPPRFAPPAGPKASTRDDRPPPRNDRSSNQQGSAPRPNKDVPTGPASYRGKELDLDRNGSQKPSSDTRPDPRTEKKETKEPSERTAPSSLSSRLGPSSSGSDFAPPSSQTASSSGSKSKRGREESKDESPVLSGPPVPSAPASLLSRLGGDDGRATKKARPSLPDDSTPNKISKRDANGANGANGASPRPTDLLSRLSNDGRKESGRKDHSAYIKSETSSTRETSTIPAVAPIEKPRSSLLDRMTRPETKAKNTDKEKEGQKEKERPSLSIRNAASASSSPVPTPTPSPAPLSIAGRAKAIASPVPTPKASPAQGPVSLSIKSRAEASSSSSPAVGARPVLSIRSASSSSVADEGVVKKGRGFQKEQDGDILMIPSSKPVSAKPSSASGNGGGGGGGGGGGWAWAAAGLRRPGRK